MGVPLDNAEQSTFSETEIVSSVGENLEDYELFLDSVDGDEALSLIHISEPTRPY